MGNRVITLYVENNDVEIAKSQGVNLSLFFREALAIKLSNREIEQMTDPKDQIKALNNKLALMAEALAIQNKKIEKLENEIKEKNEKIENLKKGIDGKVIWVAD